MNYKQIKEAAQSYVDRYDQELIGAIPGFTKVVESKINTALKTGEQAVRAQIWLERDKEYYGLPSDWAASGMLNSWSVDLTQSIRAPACTLWAA